VRGGTQELAARGQGQGRASARAVANGMRDGASGTVHVGDGAKWMVGWMACGRDGERGTARVG